MGTFTERLSSREEALALIEGFLGGGDEAAFGPMIRGMTEEADEAVFATMRGSDNDMSPFGKAMYLMRKAGLITKDETMAFITRWRDKRNARA